MEVRTYDRFRTGRSEGQPIGSSTENMLAVWHCGVLNGIFRVKMLQERIHSILYECHGTAGEMQVTALVTILNPPLTPGERPQYHFATHWVDVVAGQRVPGEEFATGVVAAAAKAAGLVVKPSAP